MADRTLEYDVALRVEIRVRDPGDGYVDVEITPIIHTDETPQIVKNILYDALVFDNNLPDWAIEQVSEDARAEDVERTFISPA